MVSLWGVLILVCLLWRWIPKDSIRQLQSPCQRLIASFSENRDSLIEKTLAQCSVCGSWLRSNGDEFREWAAIENRVMPATSGDPRGSATILERDMPNVLSIREARPAWNTIRGWVLPCPQASMFFVSASDRHFHDHARSSTVHVRTIAQRNSSCESGRSYSLDAN